MNATIGPLACGQGMHGWDGGWMWLWGSLMMLTWVAVIGGAFWLIVRSVGRNGRRSSTARELLDERFARGEVGVEEYQQRRDLLP